MTERDARIHTHASNRATPVSGARKTVFKSALDTPFRISWPSISTEVQNELLTNLVSVLEGITEYQGTLSQLNRKRKHQDQEQSVEESQEPDMQADDDDNRSSARPLVEHLTIGLNAVTKRIEDQIRGKHQNSRTIPEESNNTLPETTPDLCLVFVCRADIDPPLLVDHLPHLIAACNALHEDAVRLASLPRGAEATLAKTLGLRRVTVIGLDIEFPALERFKPYFDSIPILSAPWLSTIRHSRGLIPTHVKQVKTSAPKDMKEAKEERKKGRAQAKERKRIKIRSSDVEIS
ncbi:hypothetical protein M378DRAFT_183036 [Amanita muscaria Koide BX008]|uniref:Uncharacterized protein n=1 Tax=Amanita muscaria (strain Koide BX008) TaxID=946122 RepID=A0A0C2TW67_AMAMK|nr:hypothetical protein M378DRAFT_183036 [Amanita muscaria Koide BX008]